MELRSRKALSSEPDSKKATVPKKRKRTISEKKVAVQKKSKQPETVVEESKDEVEILEKAPAPRKKDRSASERRKRSEKKEVLLDIFTKMFYITRKIVQGYDSEKQGFFLKLSSNDLNQLRRTLHESETYCKQETKRIQHLDGLTDDLYKMFGAGTMEDIAAVSLNIAENKTMKTVQDNDDSDDDVPLSQVIFRPAKKVILDPKVGMQPQPVQTLGSTIGKPIVNSTMDLHQTVANLLQKVASHNSDINLIFERLNQLEMERIKLKTEEDIRETEVAYGLTPFPTELFR